MPAKNISIISTASHTKNTLTSKTAPNGNHVLQAFIFDPTRSLMILSISYKNYSPNNCFFLATNSSSVMIP